LFLFIIMLLDSTGDEPFRTGKVATIASLFGLALLLTSLLSLAERGRLQAGPMTDAVPPGTQLKLYAYQLFTTYLLPVEIMGFLLLIAMLGVIVLSKKHVGMEDVK